MDSKQYAEQMLNRCAEMIVEALKNMSIEDINMYQIGYEKGRSDAIEGFTRWLENNSELGNVAYLYKASYVSEQLKEQKNG